MTGFERVYDLESDLFNSRPELRAPPPLTPEGKVVAPEPEKTFLQKYWVYILAFMVILGQSVLPSMPGRFVT